MNSWNPAYQQKIYRSNSYLVLQMSYDSNIVLVYLVLILLALDYD